jgi:hypothetical protein
MIETVVRKDFVACRQVLVWQALRVTRSKYTGHVLSIPNFFPLGHGLHYFQKRIGQTGYSNFKKKSIYFVILHLQERSNLDCCTPVLQYVIKVEVGKVR